MKLPSGKKQLTPKLVEADRKIPVQNSVNQQMLMMFGVCYINVNVDY
jgi:hypothetical protein